MKDSFVYFAPYISSAISLVVSVLFVLWMYRKPKAVEKHSKNEKILVLVLPGELNEKLKQTLSLLEFKDLGELATHSMSLFIVMTDEIMKDGQPAIIYSDGRVVPITIPPFEKLKQEIRED
ncbi:MAG: hypothetical protein WC629_01415 [Candidatus Paceibacterota bacterium]